jgi:predicted O-methyltransferase YrrM
MAAACSRVAVTAVAPEANSPIALLERHRMEGIRLYYDWLSVASMQSSSLVTVDPLKTYIAGKGLTEYIRAISVDEPEILRRLREETAVHPRAEMQIPPEQGQLFRVLVGMLAAKKTLEIGVFTGYSSLVTALALPPEGRIVACDMSEEFTAVARRYWKEAGVDQKIELRLAPAADTLMALLAEGQAGSFDMAFIDADKTSYDTYYELALQLVRPGGVIVLDNMLREGAVIDASDTDPNTVAIRALNQKVGRDQRVVSALLSIADGVTLAWKKP